MQTLMTVIDSNTYSNACTHCNCGQGKTIRKWEQHTKFRYRQKKRLYLLFCSDLVFVKILHTYFFSPFIFANYSIKIYYFCSFTMQFLFFLFCLWSWKSTQKLFFCKKNSKQKNPQKNWIDAPEKVCCDSRRPVDPMINAIIINLNGA